MLKFYFSGAPNPTKVALFLEEAGLPYEPIPVDARRGDLPSEASSGRIASSLRSFQN
jgi:glutathione S-transferase